MNPIKILIIDDDKDVRRSLRDELKEEPGWKVKGRSFDALAEALVRFRPDMVVLDLVEGAGSDERATGNTSFDEIRDRWFCPVVVYSAFPEQQNFDHDLVATVTKGANTDMDVRDRLREFVQHAKLIRSVHREFDARIREALRESVHTLQTQSGATEGDAGNAALTRAVRRLVAARVDSGASSGGSLLAWERFVVPPLGEHLLTADLLRRVGAGWSDEDAFRLVLTPSCDLVPRSNNGTRAVWILVARCERLEELGKVELDPGKNLSNSKKQKLRSILTEGMAGHRIPIPEFKGHVPLMVANLNRLELLEHEQVSSETDHGDSTGDHIAFRRVASTDSPFREMVVWAYLRVTGRPGLPDFDVDSWIDDIESHVAKRVPT